MSSILSLLFFLVALGVVIMILALVTMKDCEIPVILTFFAFMGLAIVIFSIAAILMCNNTPTAMDVYQGKVILQKTYADTTVTDSIAIFKTDIEK